jgi:hypothetical protein
VGDANADVGERRPAAVLAMELSLSRVDIVKLSGVDVDDKLKDCMPDTDLYRV